VGLTYFNNECGYRPYWLLSWHLPRYARSTGDIRKVIFVFIFDCVFLIKWVFSPLIFRVRSIDIARCLTLFAILDVTVFGPFKKSLSAFHHSWLKRHPGQRISIKEVAELTRPAFQQKMSPSNIIAGFKSTGIYPFNRYAIDQSRFAPSLVTDLAGNIHLQTISNSVFLVNNFYISSFC
jgi:hypothetical protein